LHKIFCCLFGERGHRNIGWKFGRFLVKGVIENIMDIFVNIIGEMIWFLFFPSLFSDFGERGYRIILKEVIENIIHNRRG
jgi:hypothetical protein